MPTNKGAERAKATLVLGEITDKNEPRIFIKKTFKHIF